MLILDEVQIKKMGINWFSTIDVIEETVKCMANEDFVQPVKPYLRFGNPKNRIIAMPAYVGGDINMAGIKWIASFPDNIINGIPRAHSVIILNNADTGEPVCIICTALLSIIRTASVSGLIIRSFDKIRNLRDIKIGIIGFGPIGLYHLEMCLSLLKGKISNIYIYDTRSVEIPASEGNELIEVVDSWEEAYLQSDIFITCTVSDSPYIDKKPKDGSLHLNVSLRDYKVDVFEWFDKTIVVDNWEEVCREKTDIEMMHIHKGLEKIDTRSIINVVKENCFQYYDFKSPVIFNPMGMAVFDIAMGKFYYQISGNES